jgi:hypothetical protein
MSCAPLAAMIIRSTHDGTHYFAVAQPINNNA